MHPISSEVLAARRRFRLRGPSLEAVVKCEHKYYGAAAKWFLRRFADGVVRRSPTPAEVAQVQREVPGTTVSIVARMGSRLSELYRQDSYSYELADIYIGAADETELIAKYERCVRALPFEFDE